VWGAGFHAAANSALVAATDPDTPFTLALFSPYPGLSYVSASAFYPGPNGWGGANTGFDLDGHAFAMGFAGDTAAFSACHDPGVGRDVNADASGGVPRPAFGYATVISDEGAIVAAAGLFPEDAIILTETAGFRYFGGQGGLSADLDIAGNSRLTARAGMIYRSL